MEQRNSGPWSLLTNSFVYRAFQSLVRKGSFRERVLAEHVRPQAGERVLDVGCGPAAILSLMPEVDYLGIDFEAHYIQEAQERYGNRGEFRVQDIRDLQADDTKPFDLIMALGVLHHLDDTAVSTLMRTSFTLLRPGGRFVTLDPARTSPQNPIARLMVSMDRGRHVRQPDHYLQLASSVFGLDACVTTVITDGLKLPYTHCVLKAVKPA